MKVYRFHKYEIEDIEAILPQIEKSFDIKFNNNEMDHIKTFGELCDYIINKMNFTESDSCTTQQAFYKLRNALILTLKIDSDKITPNTLLVNLIPKQKRISIIKKTERHLGFKLDILSPPKYVTIFLLTFFLVSIIGIFINWQFGLMGILFSIAGLWVAAKTGKELELKTIGEVAEKMKTENYLNSRRDNLSYNRNEMEKVLTDWFSSMLAIDKSNLTRDASFV
jgi:hypothetical protein